MTQVSFSLTSHVNLVVRTCNYHLRNLWRIRRFIGVDACHHAVRALIISRLDYCNSLFTVLTGKDRKKLEIVQNRAARLIFGVGRRTHTSPLLQELHWIPFQKHVIFKTCVYVYKILHNSAPNYLEDIISLYKPARYLRSMTDKTLLTIPRNVLSVGEKSFSTSASRNWNNLPCSLRECPSLDTFKKHLKTYLFSM